MSTSFQVEEPGLEHQSTPPDVPKPETLMPESELKKHFADTTDEAMRRYWKRERPVEFRPVSLEHFMSHKKLPPVFNVWFRATGRLPDDAAIHKCVLGYASDMMLLDTALYPHGRWIFDRNMQVASLDHALWFHRPFRADEWLLYAQDSPSASGARGFTRGAIYTSEGVLVASVAQEGLIRVRDGERA